MLGPDSLSRFDELRRREAAQTAIIYAFDLIEHDGEDLRMRPLLARKAALTRLLRNTTAGLVLNEHVAGDGPTVLEHACGLGAESCPRRSTAPIARVQPGLGESSQSRQYRGAVGA